MNGALQYLFNYDGYFFHYNSIFFKLIFGRQACDRIYENSNMTCNLSFFIIRFQVIE